MGAAVAALTMLVAACVGAVAGCKCVAVFDFGYAKARGGTGAGWGVGWFAGMDATVVPLLMTLAGCMGTDGGFRGAVCATTSLVAAVASCARSFAVCGIPFVCLVRRAIVFCFILSVGRVLSLMSRFSIFKHSSIILLISKSLRNVSMLGSLRGVIFYLAISSKKTVFA